MVASNCVNNSTGTVEVDTGKLRVGGNAFASNSGTIGHPHARTPAPASKVRDGELLPAGREAKKKLSLAIAELNSTFVTFVCFHSDDSDNDRAARKNSTPGTTHFGQPVQAVVTANS